MTKRRILVIDDESAFTRLAKMNLEAIGPYEVHTEHTATSGIRAANVFQPELILLDVGLPDAQGGDVADALKSHPLLREIPIVFVTGMISREEASARNGLVGGHPFIAKPVTVLELLECITRHLGEAR